MSCAGFVVATADCCMATATGARNPESGACQLVHRSKTDAADISLAPSSRSRCECCAKATCDAGSDAVNCTFVTDLTFAVAAAGLPGLGLDPRAFYCTLHGLTFSQVCMFDALGVRCAWRHHHWPSGLWFGHFHEMIFGFPPIVPSSSIEVFVRANASSSRRRRRTTYPISANAESTDDESLSSEGATEHSSEGTTVEENVEPSESSAGSPAFDRPSASVTLQPLCAQLSKHHNSRKICGTVKRWFEVDDRLGVLYQFSGRGELERRLPRHVYALAEISKICPDAREISFKLSFCAPSDPRTTRPRSSHVPQHLVCEAGSQPLARMWVSGVRVRLLLLQGAQCPRACRTWIDADNDRRDPTAAMLQCSWNGVPTWNDSQWQHDARPHEHVRADKHARRGALARRDAMQRMGMRCGNLADSAIGAEIIEIAAGSPAAAAGLAVGDVLVAVNGTACCSYAHAERMLSEGASPVECLVWYPRGPPRYVFTPAPPAAANGRVSACSSCAPSELASDDPSQWEDEDDCDLASVL